MASGNPRPVVNVVFIVIIAALFAGAAVFTWHYGAAVFAAGPGPS
ncbi:MAG: hypothetical protein ACHP84_17840 [Caulobacterales bacterium]|jgi:hypothetical protein